MLEGKSSFCFLRKKSLQLSDGIMVVPGIIAAGMVKSFEAMLGKARQQKEPCDAGVQQEDKKRRT